MGEFYRVRTRVADSPGSLALLAHKCGAAGVNILGFQIYPDLGTVTDDLVVRVPNGWDADRVVTLIDSAGGSETLVSVCEAQELQDQPTRWLAAVRALIENPSCIEEQLESLLGARESLSATESVRAAELRGIAEALDPSALPAPVVDGVIAYRETPNEVRAIAGRSTIGAASWQSVDGSVARGYLQVAPAWQRLGVGRQLLRRLCGIAVAAGFLELVVLAPANDDGVVPMLAATGMRGRIKLTSEGLQVRINLANVRPIGVSQIG